MITLADIHARRNRGSTIGNIRKIFLAVTACVSFSLAAAALTASAQSSASQASPRLTMPAFDVVSIREIEPSQMVHTANGFFSMAAIVKPCAYARDAVECQLSLLALIEEAFQLKDFEIAGPDWLPETRYMVHATVPLDTKKDTARLMLQSALEDRFGLRFHVEKRQLSVYELIPGKHGVRLVQADDLAHRKLLDVPTPLGHAAMVSMGPGQFSAVSISMDWLAIYLRSFGALDRPVLNKTGQTGEFKIDLHWTPTEDEGMLSKGKDPEFKTAVEEQLGLRLVKNTSLIDVLVIDHVERTPSEN